MMKLPHSGPIAQAVAGEIDRLTDFTSAFQHSEGAAYKAAWDRAGSEAQKHVEAARRDCQRASLVAALPRSGALNMARFDADMVKP